jgi:hypothetical protein
LIPKDIKYIIGKYTKIVCFLTTVCCWQDFPDPRTSENVFGDKPTPDVHDGSESLDLTNTRAEGWLSLAENPEKDAGIWLIIGGST